MIVDERITSYINSMNRDCQGIIGEIERQALEDGVPIVRPETRELIKTIILMKCPSRVLEIGAAVGFSAIYMMDYLKEDAHITTIENWKPRIDQARINIEKAGLAGRITLVEGDAADVLAGMNDSYDMIFMDAAKGQYINYLPDVVRILDGGGVLLADNVLQDGQVLDSRYVVERRDRTIHSRMREYLYTVKNHELLDTAIIPIGDGVSLSVKR